MARRKTGTIQVQGEPITVVSRGGQDYVSLTDMVRHLEGNALLEEWLASPDTIRFLGVWERLNTPGFDAAGYEALLDEACRDGIRLTPGRWTEATGGRGIVETGGPHGGVFAHREIALEFGSWLSPEFRLYLIARLGRLEEDAGRRRSEAWDLGRALTRLNYRALSAAIRENLVPPSITPAQAAAVYRSEADLLNVAVFGRTAEDWRAAHAGNRGTMREAASIEQLLVLAGLETVSAELIRAGVPQEERLRRLNEIAIRQLSALSAGDVPRRLVEREACGEPSSPVPRGPQA